LKTALVGCGYVADLYVQTLALHPELKLTGVYDRNPIRLKQFTEYYQLPVFDSLQQLLDSDTQLVLNLTNPSSHHEVTLACLEAGKHVYSEKPMAMNFGDAKRLVDLATSKNLLIASAPCNFLGESAQTLWKAVRDRVLGDIYAVYAEMDDGLVHRMPYQKWSSASGAPWPANDEFEVGCTLEHAGYVLSWLCGMFGPAKHVTAFGSVAIKDKITDEPLASLSPDLTVACICFESGVVARLTCSIVGEHDHSIRMFCEGGILGTDDSWNYRSPVWIRRYITIRRRMMLRPFRKKLPLLGRSNALVKYGGSSMMDFCRGPAEMVQSLAEQRPCRLSADFSLHVNELSLAISNATQFGVLQKLETDFEPLEPMPWAK
jgi:predicted dehydrogenase